MIKHDLGFCFHVATNTAGKPPCYHLGRKNSFFITLSENKLKSFSTRLFSFRGKVLVKSGILSAFLKGN